MEPLNDETEAVLAGVGARLRLLRQRHQVTLSDLAADTGISISTLSRLESGQRRPTLELLLPLARAHGVQIDELVGAPLTGDPRVHMRPVTVHGMTMVPLTRHVGGVQAYKLIIPAGGREGHAEEPDLKTHEGYEWLFVLSGRLRLVLGSNDLILAKGEAAEFDTRVPHWFTAADVGPDSEPVELLSLFGAQGERVHLRARPRRRGE